MEGSTMFCAKCGHELKNGAEFCSNCGEKQDNSLTEERNELPQSQQKDLRLPIILLSAGVGLALLIFLISWIGYGRIYFFNGYRITSIGWIVSFLFTVLGFVLLLLDLKKRDNKKGIKSQIIAAVSLITVIPIVLISSAVINGAKQTTSSKSYYNSPSYIQNAFESCHSTAEHKQALYSYDLNNDNTISGYEMELFFKAHPRAANDKLFMKWLESLSE
jgi:hypothetical protein